MKENKYTIITCKVCNLQEEMCISGMPISGLCTICRKKQWRKDNPEPKKPKKNCSKCNTIISCRSKTLLCKKCYLLVNKEKIKELGNIYVKERCKRDPQYKLSLHLRSRLAHAIREGHHKLKCGSHVIDLGCSIEELKEYLESKFLPGMSWNNWSKTGWHVDHVKPLSAFNLILPEEFKVACHYTNLQPLWAKDNLSKGGTNRKSLRTS
jgi:hypothetical protein